MTSNKIHGMEVLPGINTENICEKKSVGMSKHEGNVVIGHMRHKQYQVPAFFSIVSVILNP